MISLRTILRGTLTRFLPAFGLGFAMLYLVLNLFGPNSLGVLGFATVGALMTLGYGAALVALRYKLRADADVAGRRSIVAGLLGPAAYLGGLMFLAPRSDLAFNAAGILIGAVLAVGMFFPWLKGNAVPALTDLEAQQLLEEGRSDFSGLGRVAESRYAAARKDDSTGT